MIYGGRVRRVCILAVQFATILPTASLVDVSEVEMRISVALWPLIGAALGGVLWVSTLLLRHFLMPLPASVLAVTLFTILTGALHLDGLMDTVDAIGSRAHGEKALAIMRDSRVGAMGAAAGCLVLIGKVAALTNLSTNSAMLYILIPTLSRAAMVWAMMWAPAARGKEGLGGLYAQQIPIGATLSASAVAVVGALFMDPILRGIALLAGAFVLAFGLTRLFDHRFGGMTGDTYGAINEVVEWLGWLLCVVQ